MIHLKQGDWLYILLVPVALLVIIVLVLFALCSVVVKRVSDGYSYYRDHLKK